MSTQRGQKKPKSCQRSLWTTPYFRLNPGTFGEVFRRTVVRQCYGNFLLLLTFQPFKIKCCNQHCTAKTEASAGCIVILKYIFSERRNFRRTTVCRRARTKPDGLDLKLFGAKSCCSQFQEESENLERITLYSKSWGWQLSFFHSFTFIFANNAKIHDRLLYWAPLTYKTKNKHTLHSMIHTNTFF